MKEEGQSHKEIAMTKKAEEQREIERFYAAEFKMGYMASEECESKKEGSL